MGKQVWKPGNMLYPLPVVMVSVRDRDGQDNIITVAWAGTVCTNPPMVSISVRPERHSYRMIKESGEFVINLVTEQLVKAADYCGVRSGRDVDKFKEMRLEKAEAEKIHAPMILNSPVNIECKVTECKELGSHHMFLATVEAVHIDEDYLNEKGKFCLNGHLFPRRIFFTGKKGGKFRVFSSKEKEEEKKKVNYFTNISIRQA